MYSHLANQSCTTEIVGTVLVQTQTPNDIVRRLQESGQIDVHDRKSSGMDSRGRCHTRHFCHGESREYRANDDYRIRPDRTGSAPVR